jgi:hypothetical protein
MTFNQHWPGSLKGMRGQCMAWQLVDTQSNHSISVQYRVIAAYSSNIGLNFAWGLKCLIKWQLI